MNPDEMNETVGKSVDTKEMDEEQRIGKELFRTTCNILEQGTLIDWMLGRKWEDTLVPVRLPEGMTELLKQMDKARTAFSGGSRCNDCRSKAGCQMLLRNPSEILLTTLLKLAFSAAGHKQQK